MPKTPLQAAGEAMPNVKSTAQRRPSPTVTNCKAESSEPYIGVGFPKKESNDMNMVNHQAFKETSSTETAACVSFSAERLSHMNSRELYCFCDALRVANESLLGIINQPRFEDEETKILNAAGGAIEEIIEFFNRILDQAEKTAKSTVCDDPYMDEYRAWTILKINANYCDDLSGFVALAAELSSRNVEVGFHDRHRRSADNGEEGQK